MKSKTSLIEDKGNTSEVEVLTPEKRFPDFTGTLSVAGWDTIDRNGNACINISIGQYCRLYKKEKNVK